MTRPDLRLNAIVDGSLREVGNLARLAALAADNGATLIQYRDKTADTGEMIETAVAIGHALKGGGVPLLVNDRVDVALAAMADGVHLGRTDMPPEIARRLLGPDAIIGLTVKSREDARTAIVAPIDYACIGGVFETLSKANAEPPLGIKGFSDLRRMIVERRPELPVAAIAGIDEARAFQVVRQGADGVAAISAVFRGGGVADSARTLRAVVDTALGRSAR